VSAAELYVPYPAAAWFNRSPARAGSGLVRIDPLRFLAGCRKRPKATKPGSVCPVA